MLPLYDRALCADKLSAGLSNVVGTVGAHSCQEICGEGDGKVEGYRYLSPISLNVLGLNV